MSRILPDGIYGDTYIDIITENDCLMFKNIAENKYNIDTFCNAIKDYDNIKLWGNENYSTRLYRQLCAINLFGSRLADIDGYLFRTYSESEFNIDKNVLFKNLTINNGTICCGFAEIDRFINRRSQLLMPIDPKGFNKVLSNAFLNIIPNVNIKSYNELLEYYKYLLNLYDVLFELCSFIIPINNKDAYHDTIYGIEIIKKNIAIKREYINKNMIHSLKDICIETLKNTIISGSNKRAYDVFIENDNIEQFI